MRQVSGASKKDLALQFLTESAINILISFLLSLFLIHFAKPIFNNITGKNIELSFEPLVIIITAFVFLLSVIFSAVYPFLLEKDRKFTILSNLNKKPSFKGSTVKPALIITQIALSIIILIGTFVVYKQLNFIREKEVGFNKESVLYIPMNEIIKKQYDAIKGELLLIPEIQSVSASSTLPTEINWWISVSWQGQKDEKPLNLAYAMVDYDFFKTMDIELIDGRGFSKDRVYDDSISYIISEMALKKMGIKEPIGHEITMDHYEFPERLRTGRIIGVFKDIHFSSLHSPTYPLLMRMHKPWLFYMLLKCNKNTQSTVLSKVSDILKNTVPGLENEIYFLDAEYNRQYKQEIIVGELFRSFAIIIISIFILGLLGLIGFILENKYKEIGVRKVNGARSYEILAMLNKEFIKWIVIAFVIACPVAWYAMTKWLENFAYKTELSWWIFALAGIITILIAFLTVSWQTWRAASRNPVEALRYE